MKLQATISPNKAGYQSPIFLTDGENIDGKLNTIHMNPRMQIIRMRIGRLMVDCIFDLPIYRLSDMPIFGFMLLYNYSYQFFHLHIS